MHLPQIRSLSLFALLGLALSLPASADLSETFDTYPDGGTGWTTDWEESTTPGTITTSLLTTDPLNGGGSYLSVSSDVTYANLGVRRDIGTSVSALPYTLTFDYRVDSDLATFDSYSDRIHIGATTGTASTDFGTSGNWAWIVGVVGADQTPTNQFADGYWYFYDNTSTSTSGGFTSTYMEVTDVLLTQGVTYHFTIAVNPAAQTYDATLSGSDMSFYSQTGLNFRNQGATDAASNLVFGTSTSSTANFTYSLDNISIAVPEPSTAALLALSGLLGCARRQR